MAKTVKTGTFSIKVKGEDDVVIFERSAEPYEYPEVESLADIFAEAEAALTDDQINFMGEVFSTEKQGEVIKSLIELYNADEKSKAKANAYQALSNQYKPLSEDDKNKAMERAIRDFAKARGITIEEAKAKLA